MLIVNKELNDVYNLDHITNIYISADGRSVKVCAGNTSRGGILGKYNSYEATQKALKILLNGIEKNSQQVLYMPNDSQVDIKTQERYHHITGKKIKGHGGS